MILQRSAKKLLASTVEHYCVKYVNNLRGPTPEQLFICKLGGGTHPLGQSAHPLRAFRASELIDYFSLFYDR